MLNDTLAGGVPRLARRFALFAGLVSLTACFAGFHASAQAPTPLRDGWALHTGCGLTAAGPQISTPGYDATGWKPVTVPSTVLAAQVAEGEFPNPYFARNLRNIPGSNYPQGDIFSNLPMPAGSPYTCAFWFRRAFHVPAMKPGSHLWLHFGGINYRANIWLNGKLVADDKHIAGAYRVYDLDATGAADPRGDNMLAVEVWAPRPTDLGINWVDWNPTPPDKDMGLTGEVTASVGGPVLLRSPAVTTHFTDGTLARARLTVYGQLRNSSAQAQQAVVSATLLGHTLTQKVHLDPWQTTTVVFDDTHYPALDVANPRIWWPYQMGTPHLEPLKMTAQAGDAGAQMLNTSFGIREITATMTTNGAKLFHVNGKQVLIRGGGWSQDMLLRENPDHLRQELELTRDLGLNTIRLEGKLETEEFYQMADQQGLLILAGWCCCDQWEHWKKWTPENYAVAADSVRSQVLRLRGHPSLLVWLNGSDNPPIPYVERAYLRIEQEEHWPNPTVSSASAQKTVPTGPSGVKMTGPYDYVAPSYWLADTGKYGGAWGFNTETSPGPAVPMESSLRQFLPTDQMIPGSPDWQYHNGSGSFQTLKVFDAAMDHTYGTPRQLSGYERYAQTMAYDGERAMYEAYERNKYVKTTGIVQWMLNNAWPSTIWHLFDYYLDAGGGYYGARKANEPLHAMYSYDNHSVVVINNRYTPSEPVHVEASVYDLNLKQEFTATKPFTAPPDSSTAVVQLPDSLFDNAHGLHFVSLSLVDAQGKHVSDNFYWVPAKLTTWDWAKTDYTHTPAATYPDLTALNTLPQTPLTAKLKPGPQGTFILSLFNPSKTLAFQVFARARTKNGDAIDPAFWSDNYIELMPGETRTLSVHLDPQQKAQRIGSVAVAGWNVPEQLLKVQ